MHCLQVVIPVTHQVKQENQLMLLLLLTNAAGSERDISECRYQLIKTPLKTEIEVVIITIRGESIEGNNTKFESVLSRITGI